MQPNLWDTQPLAVELDRTAKCRTEGRTDRSWSPRFAIRAFTNYFASITYWERNFVTGVLGWKRLQWTLRCDIYYRTTSGRKIALHKTTIDHCNGTQHWRTLLNIEPLCLPFQICVENHFETNPWLLKVPIETHPYPSVDLRPTVLTNELSDLAETQMYWLHMSVDRQGNTIRQFHRRFTRSESLDRITQPLAWTIIEDVRNEQLVCIAYRDPLTEAVRAHLERIAERACLKLVCGKFGETLPIPATRGVGKNTYPIAANSPPE